MIEKDQKGFTLLEVIVAIAIIALLMVPLFIFQSRSIRSVLQLSNRMNHFIQAQNFMYQVALTTPPEVRALSIDKKTNNPKGILRFSLKESDVTLESNPVALTNTLEKRVEIASSSSDKSDMLVTFIFKPRVSNEKDD